MPATGRRAGTRDTNPLHVASDRHPQGTFVDSPLRPKAEHVIDIDPPDSSRAITRSSSSSSSSSRSVTDQLARVTQSVLPLPRILRCLRDAPPAEPPRELTARLNQRFEQYVHREVNRPLDMPRTLEFVKEREHQLALPQSEQHWDKAVQLYKKALKLDVAQVEKGWHSAGTFYPLSTIPSGLLTMLPSLTTLPFSSLKPVTGASLNLGLQMGLAMVTPVLNAGFQNFFVNLQELKRIGGLSNRSPALAGASAPGFDKASQNIEKALGKVDAALAALQSDEAGPVEAGRAETAYQQLLGAMQAYERRLDINNLNYTGQFWQSFARTARQTAYFLAPIAGQYLASQAASSTSVAPGPSIAPAGNGRYITYGIQVAATLGLWIAQQFAAPRDEKNKQEATLLATLKHTDVRKASAIEGKVAADDLTEAHIDAHEFRNQWRGTDKVRLTAVNDILQNRIAGVLDSAAKLVGLTPQEWVTLKGLESRRHESPAPLDPRERTLLDDIRQRTHEHISRADLLEWMRLEERARNPLSQDESRQFSVMEKKFKTSMMSEHAWDRLRELERRSEANPDSLTWPEREELAKLQERSTSSLTVAEHARLETLRIRRKFSPDAKDIATLNEMETKVELNSDERAVLARARLAQGDAGQPVSADDFLAAGTIRRDKLGSNLDEKETAAYLQATSRISTGLTREEQDQYLKLRSKGRFELPETQAQLRDLEQQVQELRLDKRLMGWDWSKLSAGTQSAVDSALSGASDRQLAWQTTKARLGQRQEVTPQIAQRYGASFQMVFGGATMPFIVGAGFRLASALGKKVDFASVRVPAGLATLAIGVMGSWASGTLINFKITERARLRKLAEESPSATQLLLSSIPRAIFALPAEIQQLRRSAKVATSGKQWLDRQGEYLQLAIKHATQRADRPPSDAAVPQAAGRAGGGAHPVPVASPSPGAALDLTRTDHWLRAMDDLLAITADAHRRAIELRGTMPSTSSGSHRSAVQSLPV